MRISWRLCNNSEIHLWFWKLWNLVVRWPSCPHVTKARKDNKNRQNTLFLCWEKMNLVPKKQLLPNVPFQSTTYRKKELCLDNKVQETIGDVHCQTCRNEKCVYVSNNKTASFYDCKKCKACCHVLNTPFKDQKPTIMFMGGDGTHCFARKTSPDYEIEKPSPIWRNFSANHNQAHPNLNEKRQKLFYFWHNRDYIPLVDTVSQNFIHILILYNFSLHWSNMIFSVSYDGIEWSLGLGPDSVILTVKDLVQEMTISSQEIPLADWSLLLSQKQPFLNNHLAWVPVTSNQQGTHERRDEVLSSVGAQDMDTNGYQVSAHLKDVEFYWENDQLDVDDTFRPGIDTPFSLTAFDDLEMGCSAENSILLDEEEDKENSPAPPQTPVSERSPRPPA